MQVELTSACVSLFNIHSFMSHFCNSLSCSTRWVTPFTKHFNFSTHWFLGKIWKYFSIFVSISCYQRNPNLRTLIEWIFISQMVTYLTYSVPVLFSPKHFYVWANPVITSFLKGASFAWADYVYVNYFQVW